MAAVKQSNQLMVKQLVKKNADITLTDNEGKFFEMDDFSSLATPVSRPTVSVAEIFMQCFQSRKNAHVTHSLVMSIIPP